MDSRSHWWTWEGMNNAAVPPSLLSLCRMLPEQLWVLYDPQRLRYCYRTLASTEDCGLLAFSQPHFARLYAADRLRHTNYTQVWPVTLDQACALARERHAVVNSVLLMDNPRQPAVHHVR